MLTFSKCTKLFSCLNLLTIGFLMNSKDFLYLSPQFTLTKYVPLKYSIFQRQELQNLKTLLKSNFLTVTCNEVTSITDVVFILSLICRNGSVSDSQKYLVILIFKAFRTYSFFCVFPENIFTHVLYLVFHLSYDYYRLFWYLVYFYQYISSVKQSDPGHFLKVSR